MSSAAYFRFEEPVPFATFEAWCDAVGATYSPNTVGGNVWYAGDMQMTFGAGTHHARWQNNRPPRTAERVSISTYYGGDVAGVADLALSFWFTVGGSMNADPEVKAAVLRRWGGVRA